MKGQTYEKHKKAVQKNKTKHHYGKESCKRRFIFFLFRAI